MTRHRERSEAGEYEAPTEAANLGDQGAASAAPAASPDLDAMTKDELLAHAQGLGLSPANATMTKADLRAAIEAHYAEG